MSQMARESSESASLLPSKQYHYGFLIDSPPSPLILSRQTLYTEEFLKNLGMKQICKFVNPCQISVITNLPYS